MIKGSFGNLGKTLSLFLALLIIAVPILAQQTQQEVLRAEQQGEQDAIRDHKKMTWFIVGCLALVPGLLIATLIEPRPPQAAILGKSPDYVAAYTDAYVRKTKGLRTNWALYGCGTGALLYVGLWVAVIAAAASETTYY